jgi:exopolyphosphatase/guanosine-5'-triphosphate,3'-diphosphate pyrophosphatase
LRATRCLPLHGPLFEPLEKAVRHREVDLAERREDRKDPDAKLRVGVLDLGSTSFHLVVADASPTGTIERVVRRRVMLRLGATIADEGDIPKSIAARAVETARELRLVAEEHGAEILLPVATAALRDARNGAALSGSIERVLGTPVRLLSGIEEARLIFAAFRHRIRLGNAPALGMDLGGGSLELAIGDGFEVHWETTLPLGVTRLHGEFDLHDPMKRREWKEIQGRVEECLAESRKQVRSRAPKLQIVSGGTARALARIVEEGSGGRSVKGGLRVSAGELSKLAQDLADAPYSERLRMPGMKRSRADLLPTGAVILDAVMGCLSLPDLLICDWGLREGVILEALGLVDGRGSAR